MKEGLIVLIAIAVLLSFPVEAKKVRNSFVVAKERNSDKKERSKSGKGIEEITADRLIVIGDTLNQGDADLMNMVSELKQVTFAGYDKEVNSNYESFIMVNPTKETITGFEVRIDYYDMQGRMLHSSTQELKSEVPAGESRRFDIKSWDTQHTYYYYLGNEPKKVSTPFKVAFTPLSYRVADRISE